MHKSILVPTDFSEVAYHAASYAIQLGKQIGIKKLVLYHAWQQPIIADANMVNADLINAEELREIGDENLTSFVEKITKIAGQDFEIIKEIDYNPVAGGVADASDKYNAAYVIMSVTGSGKFVEKVIGSNAVSVAKEIHIPVIIVPGNYTFEAIDRIALSCDYKDIESTIPFTPIKDIVSETGAKLFVVNVDTTREHSPEFLEEENSKINRLLGSTDTEFHVLEEDKYIDAINNFTVQQGIDLVIAIPKKKGFFESLFKGSRTTELAFNSKKPIMVIHHK